MMRPLVVIVEIIIFALLFIVNIVPILWGFLTSIKPENIIFEYPPRIFNFKPVWDHYLHIINGGFLKSVLISLFYSSATIIVCALLATMTAYGFDRYHFPFKKHLFLFVVVGIPLAIGSAALLIPNFLYLSKLGLTNNRLTLILLYSAYNLPMAIWIMKGMMESIPISIDEAARIDGCHDFYILFRIIFPLTKPALAAAAIFAFIGSWNEFITASVMVDSVELRPVQLSIYNYMGFYGLEWGPLTASACLAILPIVTVFSVLSKMLVSGLTQGSTKM